MIVKFDIHTVQEDEHHKTVLNRKTNKRVQIKDDVTFLYKDAYGLLHATGWTDIAGSKTGTFLMTDEVQTQGGLPAIDGKPYTIWGATDTYVYLTANKRPGAEFHFASEEKKEDGKISTVVPHNDKKMMEDCKTLAGLYLELAE